MESSKFLYHLTCLILLISWTIALNEPPSITLGPTGDPMYSSSAGRLDSLYCLANGSTDGLEYTWYVGTGPLTGVPFTHDRVTGQLSITSRAPEGTYQCRVTNKFGTALSYKVDVKKIVMTPDSSDQTKRSNATLGTSFTMPCNVGASIIVPGAGYRWEIVKTRESTAQAAPIILNRRIQIDEKGYLYFASVLQGDDQGGQMYRCHLVNNRDNAQEFSVSYTILSLQGPAVVADAIQPLFVSPSSTTALRGGEVTLRCFFSGRPDIVITWKRADGKSIVGSRFDAGTSGENSGRLTIKNIVFEDEGDYVCSGSASGLATIERTIKLSIEAVPYINSPEGMVNTRGTVGRSVTFNCSVSAVPPITERRWFRNGEEIQAGSLPKKFSFNQDESTLTINNLCKGCGDEGDLGVIQCEAKNARGYVLGQGYINVFAPTVITNRPKDTQLNYPNPVEFTCDATSDPDTPITYKWTRNGEQVLDGRLNTSIPGRLIIDISNMQDKGEIFKGQWKCEVTNGISSDDASAWLGDPIKVASAGVWKFWWIPFIIILILLLLLLLLLLACCCLYRNRGNQYPVDEKERKGGHDPVKELQEGGFHDYQRPADRVDGPTIPETAADFQQPRLNGTTTGSINSSFARNSDDEMSLNDYSNINPGKFTEDGSFIGQYNPGSRRGGGRTVNNRLAPPLDSVA